MTATDALGGQVRQVVTPAWDALEGLVDDELARRFGWVSEVALDDGTRVHVYKDIQTLRHLYLSSDGRAFHFTEDRRYREIDPRTALIAVFVDVGGLSEVESAALRLALAKLDRELGAT